MSSKLVGESPAPKKGQLSGGDDVLATATYRMILPFLISPSFRASSRSLNGMERFHSFLDMGQ